MDNLSKIGQKADIYIVELAPQIVRARHHVFFGSFLQTAPEFSIPATAMTWPHERPLQNINATIASLQQIWVRRKQRQAIAAAKRQSGTTVETADAACRAYYKAAADLEIRRACMKARVARRLPALRAA